MAMLPLGMADLEMGLRAVLAQPAAVRQAQAVKIVRRAAQAHAHRLAHDALHPQFGNGTLYAAAVSAGVAPRPPALDQTALTALQHLLDALGGGQTDHNL